MEEQKEESLRERQVAMAEAARIAKQEAEAAAASKLAAVQVEAARVLEEAVAAEREKARRSAPVTRPCAVRPWPCDTSSALG